MEETLLRLRNNLSCMEEALEAMDIAEAMSLLTEIRDDLELMLEEFGG